MRYVVDESKLDFEASRAAARVVLEWAAGRARRFMMTVEPDVYHDRGLAARLASLGAPAGGPPAAPARGERVVRVEGDVSEALVREVLAAPKFARAVSADNLAVDTLVLEAGARRLYASHDYGRTQVLDLTDEEAAGLRQALADAGLDAAVLTAAPPYPGATE